MSQTQQELEKLLTRQQQPQRLDTINEEISDSMSSQALPPDSLGDSMSSARGQGEDVRGLFEKKRGRKDQFESDVDLWHKTLTEKGDLQGDELRVHEEQQDILKRHFAAMAVLGPQAGDQETGDYQNIDHFAAVDEKMRKLPELLLSGANITKAFPSNEDMSPTRAPLASLASHGGRLAYESANSEIGETFKNQLLFGADTPEGKETQASRRHQGWQGVAPGSGSRASDDHEKRDKKFHAGLYSRNSSHPQEFNNKAGRWEEKKGATNLVTNPGEESLGMNIAFGGVGNQAEIKGKPTTIGPEGDILNSDRKRIGQHGHAFFKSDSHKESQQDLQGSSRLMVGFEGSAPSQDSLHGTHGLKSMIKKGGE